MSALEFRLIQTHAQAGAETLEGIEFPWDLACMIRQHHERIDGSGYPDGIQGDAILLESRILSVADVLEAMVSHRPYRPAVGLAAAVAELQAGSGTRYDPDVVTAALQVIQQTDLLNLPEQGFIH